MTHSAVSVPPRGRFRRIDADTAADLIIRRRQGVLPSLALFDSRDRAAFDGGHVQGAAHLTDAGFAAAMAGLSRASPVLIYCYHGNASQTWAGMFADFRYQEVYSVDGGYAFLAGALERRAWRGGAAAPDPSPALAAFLAEYAFDGAHLEQPRAHGLTPLMRAALVGRLDLVEELLACGVAVNTRNSDGNNALWLACVSGNGALVDRLVAAGIDQDNRNDMGATCLMYAASSGKHEMVARLLAAGADPRIRNFDDARAVDLCATRACLKLLRGLA
ncbi:MAG: ankyrin repeat domain-containing protein [Rhodocyclaceae bacterium]|jgi:rhodanese-related sulfurtransferase|nr:ankyrin repeat domain-containing protein [Rhodocyclaceae bacterium]